MAVHLEVVERHHCLKTQLATLPAIYDIISIKTCFWDVSNYVRQEDLSFSQETRLKC